MPDESESKPWFQSVPGILTGLAAVIAAITALIVAIEGKGTNNDKPAVETSKSHLEPADSNGVEGCTPPYVWRLAVASDRVCVLPESRSRVELENQRAAERRQASGGDFGADTCVSGYVWREAFDGDTVCVTPERRDEVKAENANSSQHMQH